MELSKKTISLSENDVIMSVRLAAVTDLVAAEGNYHLQCWLKFERRMKLNADESRREHENDKYMDRLCYHLLGGLERGYVYDMGEVWTRYKNVCE